MKRSVSTSTTSTDESFLFTRIANASRECSSTTFSSRYLRRSRVRSSTESQLHTWLRWVGLRRMQDPSFSHNRLCFGCLDETLSPSRRQMRSTRLGFTIQPSARNNAVTGR